MAKKSKIIDNPECNRNWPESGNVWRFKMCKTVRELRSFSEEDNGNEKCKTPPKIILKEVLSFMKTMLLFAELNLKIPI